MPYLLREKHMRNVDIFNLKRLGWYIKSDLVINASSIITFGATISVLVLLFSLISVAKLDAANFHPVMFVLVLFIGGLWLTSKSFTDVHDSEKNRHFLMLPISNLERFLGRLILTTVGYVAGIAIVFFVISLLLAGITFLAFKQSSVIFNPFDVTMLKSFADYIFFQSIFFLGAIYFRSKNLSKTIISLCLLALFFIISASIVFEIFSGQDIFYGFQSLRMYTTMIKTIVTLLVIPCSWLIAYLRLCESEG
jgi:hypothetical protein